MKKIFFLTLTLFLLLKSASAQQGLQFLYPPKYGDSLKHLLAAAKEDTNKVNLYLQLGRYYQWNYPDSSLLYTGPGSLLAKKLDYATGQLRLLRSMAPALIARGNYAKALQTGFQGLTLAEKLNNRLYISAFFWTIGYCYEHSGDYKKALVYYFKAKSATANFLTIPLGLSENIGSTYYDLNNLDSALKYTGQAYEEVLKTKSLWPVPCFYMAKIYEKKGELKKALYYAKLGVNKSLLNHDKADSYVNLAGIYKKLGEADSSTLYANKAIAISIKSSFLPEVVDAGGILASLYKARHLADSALKYQDIMLTAKDNVFSREKIQQMQLFAFDEQMRQQEILKQQEQYNNRIKMYGLVAIVIVFLVIAVILWRNNRLQQKANEKIQKTLAELKTTQTQLIQSEKMASLGELTAGIAHEIQNPLNFVNNFSEVSIEMLDEMEQELTKGDKAEAIAIAADIKQNLEKIHHHGQRADGIVKGMLQHSRASSTTKEPTDINKLADEYLRLAYHGLRAKDKSFNAELETNFADNLPLITVVPQDIGRVLLNLFTNAFYATQQKVKNQGGDNYKPVVKIDTKINNRYIEITVGDNGTGIPEDIKEKVLQPFFTTKPTGEGTGLGLSLSYDIVVKGHNGKIEVNSEEGKYTAFKISIPA